MIPYSGLFFFGVALYALLPAIAVGVLGRRGAATLFLVTAFMTLAQFGTAPGPLTVLGAVAAFLALEYAVARALLWVRTRWTRRWPGYAAIALALVPLAAARRLLPAPQPLVGFVGLSYVTFRALDAIFAIHDGTVMRLPFAQFFTYLFFFPALSAGPIDRYKRFAADWESRPERSAYVAALDAGVARVFRGLLYKFILAELINRYWLTPLDGAHGLAAGLAYMYAYSAYLFFDFAGYSALAVGVSLMLGVHTPENFDRPFLARNIRDFWNRWHMSLSFWFRDHVYTRFLLAAKRGRWFEDRYLPSHLGFLLTMGLMGVWHGTAPRYVLYGLYHGVLLVGHDVFSRWNASRKLWGEGPLWRAAEIALTVEAVCFGFLLFSGRLL